MERRASRSAARGKDGALEWRPGASGRVHGATEGASRLYGQAAHPSDRRTLDRDFRKLQNRNGREIRRSGDAKNGSWQLYRVAGEYGALCQGDRKITRLNFSN